MVDTPALGAGGVTPVEVRVLSSAPVVTCLELRIRSDFDRSQNRALVFVKTLSACDGKP